MWPLVYLAGIAVVALVVTCWLLAREGVGGADDASMIGTALLFGLSSTGVLFALLLMLAGQKLSEGEGFWAGGKGQFLVAVIGLGAVALAASFVRRRRYIGGAVLIVAAACLFGFWGLLLEAEWSNRGPLALVS